jgi:hypothetical protein
VVDVEQDRTVSEERERPLVCLENLDSELARAARGTATISERQSMRAIVAPATLRHIGLATRPERDNRPAREYVICRVVGRRRLA